MATPGPVDIFFSYSHKDEALRDELAVHLSVLRRNGDIRDWHDRRIGLGERWKEAVDDHLESARVILLLLSADFLASDYCYDSEVRRALERQRAGAADVVPILLRDCDWTGTPLARLDALPRDAKPVTSWEDRDAAWSEVTRGIRAAVERIQSP